LLVTNIGPGDDPGPVRVIDTLPAGLSYVSSTGDGWSCAASGSIVTCLQVGPLTAGATSPTLNIVTKVDTSVAGAITNDASVASTVAESQTVNNPSRFSVTVAAASTGSPLAFTGSSTWTLLLVAAGSIAGGLTLFFAAGRRTHRRKAEA